MRARAAVLAALLAGFGQQMPAQTAAVPAVVEKTPIVTLNQDVLFTGSKYGRALQAQFEAESATLLAENRKIDAELEAEERALTDKRATMTATSFRPLAEAFDKKANELRDAQGAKSRALTQRSEERRQKFFQAVAPILGDYMVSRGAVAILDKSAVVVSLGAIDITNEAIAQIDAKLGDGAAAP